MQKSRDIFLYVPNIIGYFRILFCILATSVIFSNPIRATIFYILSQGLDAIDGAASRYQNQTSKFGAMLDMIMDRVCTQILLIVLSHQYKKYWWCATGFIVLDIASHWFQMIVASLTRQETHKKSKNLQVDIYYKYVFALTAVCTGSECFLLCQYLGYFYVSPYIYFFAIITFPIFCIKQFVNLLQLLSCCKTLTEYDIEQHNNTTYESSR